MYKTRKWIGASGLALIISIWGMSDAKAQTEVKDLKQSKPPATNESIVVSDASSLAETPITNSGERFLKTAPVIQSQNENAEKTLAPKVKPVNNAALGKKKKLTPTTK